LLAYGVVAFLHGGSPFKVWQPDSFRIRLNRRSTFNFGWDILGEQAQALAKEENRTMSELMREALRQYRFKRTVEKARAHMEAVADRIGVHTEEDVVELVRQVRREMAQERQE
jgi:predicted CopG family antitoxin